MKKTLMALAAVFCLGACKPKVELTTITAPAESRDITTTVTATGTIEPVTSVDVGTQVSGIVSRLYVDYNSQVKAGQVIAELDRTNLTSDLESAQANLRSARSELNYQQTNYERYKALHEKGLISANDYDQALLAYTKAQQSVNQITQSVKRAQTNLGYATITSPIDGVVLSKEVEEGQTVAASFNTPTLFKIARDLTDMRVIAKVDEADIGEVKDGQRVTFTVDAFPNDTFEGTVTQVRQQAVTESNVVTYEVVISAPNQDLKLKPGLTANVSVHTLDLSHVLAVPVKALRFMPSDDLLAEGESIQDLPEARAKVWVKEGLVYKAVAVETGSSNGIYAQVTRGLKEGTQVVTAIESASMEPEPEQAANPFMPKPRNRRGNKK